MKSMTLGALAFAGALALASTGAAKPANACAITITETISFTASDFFPLDLYPPAPPVDPVIGAFTITLDPTINITGGTTITLDNINITPSTIAPSFNYNPEGGTSFDGSPVQGPFLRVCSSDSPGPIECVTSGANGFFLAISNFQSTPTFDHLTYSQSGVFSRFTSLTGTVSADSAPTYDPVPGPIVGAGLPGLILACGVLLVLGRRRRKIALASA